jgi:NAD(P)-dependent dehydrogenase (short-subunit alcohol dehydrogenase family)
MELAGKTAVVTGGGSGIGRGIALGLAAEGMTVAVADLRADSAEEVAREIGGSAFALPLDVVSTESLAAAAKEVESRAGITHVLCANAGVMTEIGPLAERSAEDWEYVFSVNVHGVVKTVQAFLPQLRRAAPDAHIVNTASLGGLISVEGFPIGVYIASKYACVGYSESLRAELAKEGIGVSVLCPGTVQSDLYTTSATNRPAHYGAHHQEGSTAPPLASEEIAAQFMPAEDVGPIVVRGIQENRLHILTHPDTRPLVEARFRQVLDDFDFAERGKGS